MSRLPAFYTARTWFAPPTPDERLELAVAGCPAPWINDALTPAPEQGHYAWVGLVAGRPAGAMVAKVVGDRLHVDGWLTPALRGLGLATEALHGLASEVLVRGGQVPIPSRQAYEPFTRRHSPSALVIDPGSPAGARVVERCGARRRDGVWVLDLVAHTGLDRAPVIDGHRVARLIASLRPSDAAALESIAAAHHQRLQAAIEAARARVKPVARFAGVQALVDDPPTEPATEADVEALLEHAYAERIDDALAVVRRRLFSDRQLLGIHMNLDDSHLHERERTESWADLCDWLSDYERVRKG